TPFRYCNPRNCAKECQGRGKETTYCDEVCKCSGW
uniref:Potassium channel toxin n=1 Tax=Tityus metuendus TaxID=2203750 RepID=KAX_TITME|nr:RecName: Full=Potassium channel toxin [Tityus metuendus]